jgi:predicted porin
MKKLQVGVACAAICATFVGEAFAQVLRTNAAGWDLTATGALSAQAGTFEDPATGLSDEDGDWDGSLILNAERVTATGLSYGIRGEVDTGNRQAEELQRDEIYLYVAGDFGRFELGEQDGPADTISYHAPVVGLGQIRGDFVRYTGTAALLSAFDTRDSLKAIYLSAPIGGFRWGVSYAPEFTANEDAANPRSRTIQKNAFEAAAAYQATFGGWAGGISVAYVGGEADPITERGDLESWSVGLDFRRDNLSIGGGYVSRGDSNSLTANLDEEEFNFGVAWRADGWGVGASASQTTSRTFDNRLIGFGGYYEFTEHWVVRADYVAIEEDRLGTPARSGHVALAEIAFVF